MQFYLPEFKKVYRLDQDFSFDLDTRSSLFKILFGLENNRWAGQSTPDRPEIVALPGYKKIPGYRLVYNSVVPTKLSAGTTFHVIAISKEYDSANYVKLSVKSINGQKTKRNTFVISLSDFNKIIASPV